MKRIILLAPIAICFFANSLTAQVKFGLRGGATLSNWDGQAVNSLQSLVKITNGVAQTQMKTGFYAGAFASLPVSERISIEPGVYYTQKGYTLKGDLQINKLNFLGANASVQVRSHYIDMPLVLRAELVKGLSVFAGPQFSYLAKDDLRLNAGVLGINLLHSNLDITQTFNRMDVAIVGGLGYQFGNGFNLNAGYDYGLSRLDKNGSFKSYNRVFKMGIGYSF